MNCPLCSSPRLSPLTAASPYNTSFRASFRVEGQRKIAQITRGRICGDCGYLLLFVDQTHLAELRGVWDQLEPYER